LGQRESGRIRIPLCCLKVLVKTLKINNLRNIQQTSLELHPTLNLLVGDNGAGKTTVLEGLMVLAKGRSFRTGNIASLVGPHDEFFRVLATIENDSHQARTLGIERDARDWRARRDGTEVRQLGELAECLPIVLMEPNSHQLVSGAPETRRRLLDWSVFHVEHAFLPTWRRYGRAVKQRNAALRTRDERMVASLDPLVADLGEDIHRLRFDAVRLLGEYFESKLTLLGQGLVSVNWRYQPGWSGERLSDALVQTRARDMERGATGPGPHRADIVFTIEGKPARDSLSRGEQKLVSAALLLAQAELMASTGYRPIILFDDLASEFDQGHRQAVLAAALRLGAQVWITGTTADSLPEADPSSWRVFHVEHGSFRVLD